ncbi:hypothetical protein [Luteibaculum oceani]|uniref:Uncharacterized protein n=1 Tax=Luteibaculum oceani TaxID=1294296 RepID=A0A5C6UTK7_9FLAO|nr:hypothetical protein [Luteibaculum oceani]TXC75571.1 hypothetical protein FRX97_11910 [Luteibaculum oceani]
MNVNSWLQGLFNNAEKKGEPLVSQELNRSTRHKEKFQKIRQHSVWQTFVDNVFQLVSDNKNTPNYSGMEAGFYHSKSSNGFYLTHIEDFETDYFRFLSDLMVENLQKSSYVVQMKKEEHHEDNGNCIGWEKWYLKPKTKFSDDERLIQSYGNVQIEFKICNNQPKLFKLQSNTYQGYNYHPPLPHKDLWKLLFTV